MSFSLWGQVDRAAPIWTSAGVLAGGNHKLALKVSTLTALVKANHVITLCTIGWGCVILRGRVCMVGHMAKPHVSGQG